jgi:hypothetical protein
VTPEPELFLFHGKLKHCSSGKHGLRVTDRKLWEVGVSVFPFTMHSLNKHLLSTYLVPGIVLGARGFSCE